MVSQSHSLLSAALAATVMAGNVPLGPRQDSASATVSAQSPLITPSPTQTLPFASTSSSTPLTGEDAVCRYVAISVSAILINVPNPNPAFDTITPTVPIPPPTETAAFCSVIFSDLPANATAAARQYRSLLSSWVSFYSTAFSSLQSCATEHPIDEVTSVYESAAIISEVAQCPKSSASRSGKRGVCAAAGIAAAVVALFACGMA